MSTTVQRPPTAMERVLGILDASMVPGGAPPIDQPVSNWWHSADWDEVTDALQAGRVVVVSCETAERPVIELAALWESGLDLVSGYDLAHGRLYLRRRDAGDEDPSAGPAIAARGVRGRRNGTCNRPSRRQAVQEQEQPQRRPDWELERVRHYLSMMEEHEVRSLLESVMAEEAQDGAEPSAAALDRETVEQQIADLYALLDEGTADSVRSRLAAKALMRPSKPPTDNEDDE